MKNIKKTAVGVFAFLFSAFLYGCSSSENMNSSAENKADSSYAVQTETSITSAEKSESVDTETSNPDPDRSTDHITLDSISENELFYLSASGSEEKWADEFELFEKRGGKIKYEKCAENELYDLISAKIASAQQLDVTDFDNGLAFPYGCIHSLFQPVDPIVDLNSGSWSGTRDLADNFMLNGWHYTVPCAVLPETLFLLQQKYGGRSRIGRPV